MKVTMELVWHWRSQRYEQTTRIVLEERQAVSTPVEDLVELGVLLHARAQAMTDEQVALHNTMRQRPGFRLKRDIPRRTVLEADERELPPELVAALLDMVKQAQNARPLPQVEQVRTSIRAGLLQRYQELGLRAALERQGYPLPAEI